jgi:Prp8 binding protein
MVHKQAVTDLAFSPSNPSVLYSVGADGMLIATDLDTSERLVRYSAHYGPVNSLAVTRGAAGRELLLTGGDDGIARVWDPAREGKDPVVELDDGLSGVVTAVEWSADGSAAFVGGVDNEIKVGLTWEVLDFGS